MPNPYFIIGALLACIAAFFYGQHTGAESERVAWQARDNEAIRKANAKIIDLNDQARAQERTTANQIAAVAAHYEKEKARVQSQKESALAALRAGGLVLRDPGSPRLGTCGSQTGPTAAAPGQRDGETRSGLSPEASGFLYTEASRADEIVKQLDACQGVVLADRGEKTPP